MMDRGDRDMDYSYINEKLKIELIEGENGFTVKFSGEHDMQSFEDEISEYYTNIHNEVIRKGIKAIFCDITNLMYINSGAIKCFITWLTKINRLKDENKYTVTFLINNDIPWQQKGLSYLSKVVPGSVFFKSVLG